MGNVSSFSGCQDFRTRVKAEFDSRHFFADKEQGRFRLNWWRVAAIGCDRLLKVPVFYFLEAAKLAVLALISLVDVAERYIMLRFLERF